MKKMYDSIITEVCTTYSTEAESYEIIIEGINSSFNIFIELLPRKTSIPSSKLIGTAITQIEQTTGETSYWMEGSSKSISQKRSLTIDTNIGKLETSRILFSPRFLLRNITQTHLASKDISATSFELFDTYEDKTFWKSAYGDDENSQKVLKLYERDMPVFYSPITNHLEFEGLTFKLEPSVDNG